MIESRYENFLGTDQVHHAMGNHAMRNHVRRGPSTNLSNFFQATMQTQGRVKKKGAYKMNYLEKFAAAVFPC